MVQKITKVVHCMRDSYDVYIGRGRCPKTGNFYGFGNPFSIGKDGTRKEVIEKYRIYFYERLKKDNNFWRKVQECKNKTLGCWCKPEDCHGDIIAEYLNERN